MTEEHSLPTTSRIITTTDHIARLLQTTWNTKKHVRDSTPLTRSPTKPVTCKICQTLPTCSVSENGDYHESWLFFNVWRRGVWYNAASIFHELELQSYTLTRGQYISPKHQRISIILHGATFQMMAIFMWIFIPPRWIYSLSDNMNLHPTTTAILSLLTQCVSCHSANKMFVVSLLAT